MVAQRYGHCSLKVNTVLFSTIAMTVKESKVNVSRATLVPFDSHFPKTQYCTFSKGYSRA